jgi:hypothetical protein
LNKQPPKPYTPRVQLSPPTPPCAVNCTTGRSPVDTPANNQQTSILTTNKQQTSILTRQIAELGKMTSTFTTEMQWEQLEPECCFYSQDSLILPHSPSCHLDVFCQPDPSTIGTHNHNSQNKKIANPVEDAVRALEDVIIRTHLKTMPIVAEKIQQRFDFQSYFEDDASSRMIVSRMRCSKCDVDNF